MNNQLIIKNIKVNPLLLNDIVDRFGVSEEFVFEYQNLYPNFDWNSKTWDEFLGSLTPLNQMYVEFAMSTVRRGEYFFSLLNIYDCIQDKNRYLDIGTAYAGFLRAFKKQGFKEVIGIELQEYLARLGRANIQGLPGVSLFVGDFLLDDFESLGTFDVITCNDVIEHVDNAEFALQKMSKMLNRGGCLALEVPNKDCISFVKSDGHFQIFGITQFHRDDAANYYAAISGVNSENSNPDFWNAQKKNYLFEMGEMYSLEWYIEKLSSNGMSVIIADTHRIGDVKDVSRLCSDLKHAYADWRENIAPRLKHSIARKMEIAIETYLSQLESDFAKISDEPSQKTFENKYLRSFWTIFALKRKDTIKIRQKSTVSLLRELTRLFRFLKRFIHNPRQGLTDLMIFLNRSVH